MIARRRDAPAAMARVLRTILRTLFETTINPNRTITEWFRIIFGVNAKYRIFMRHLAYMKKDKKDPFQQKKTKRYNTTSPPAVVNEPVLYYQTIKKQPSHTAYSYKRFDTLAVKLPFTLKEWASLVHLSDRTLQRYAKENKPFEGIYADRLLQIEKVMNEAEKVFKKPIHFYEWLHEKHTVFNYILSIESLQTQDGIQMLLDELGRMQQGVYV